MNNNIHIFLVSVICCFTAFFVSIYKVSVTQTLSEYYLIRHAVVLYSLTFFSFLTTYFIILSFRLAFLERTFAKCLVSFEAKNTCTLVAVGNFRDIDDT